jgi:hypothetical protein
MELNDVIYHLLTFHISIYNFKLHAYANIALIFIFYKYQFNWTPFHNQVVNFEEDAAWWSTCTFIICFDVVEFRQTDRVRLQFGLHHEEPSIPQIMTIYHNSDMRSSKIKDCAKKYAQEIEHWNNRMNYVLRRQQFNNDPPMHSRQYIDSYTRNYHPYFSADEYLNGPRPRPHPHMPQHHNITQQSYGNYNPYYNPTQPSSYHNYNPSHIPTPPPSQNPTPQSYNPSPPPFFDNQTYESPTTVLIGNT